MKMLGILLMWIYVDFSTFIALLISSNTWAIASGLVSMICEWKGNPI